MTTTRKALALLTGCIGAGAIVLACFSDRTGPATTTAAECRVPVTVIDSLHYLIAIRDFGFHPDSLSVPPGATVTWVNCEDAGTEPHTTTSNGSVWNSPDLSPGDRFSHTFPAQGAFPYHCTPHPFMTGKVVVQ
jgi:plastocyanin